MNFKKILFIININNIIMLQSNKFKKFIIKYALISSLCIWSVGSHFKEFTECIIQSVVHPFLSIDLNGDGEPDLQQIKYFNYKIFNITFPVGKLLLGAIDFLFELIFIFIIVWMIIRYSKLIKL